MLKNLHRASACVIGLFLLAHITNQLMALHSVETYKAFMEAARVVYRNPFAETLLLACVLFQVGSGAIQIRRRKGRISGFFQWAQVLSGGYLAFFFLLHISAIMWGRIGPEVDTNYYFATVGIHVTPFQFFFLPYYFLAITAVFTHVACALHALTQNRLSELARNRMGYGLIGLGVILALLIVTALAGAFHDVGYPDDYEVLFNP